MTAADVIRIERPTTDSKIFANTRWDLVPTLAGFFHLAFFLAMFFLYPRTPLWVMLIMGFVYALMINANINGVSHNFIHNPFFRPNWMNRAFGIIESIACCFSQTYYDVVHMQHHKGNADRPDERSFQIVEMQRAVLPPRRGVAPRQELQQQLERRHAADQERPDVPDHRRQEIVRRQGVRRPDRDPFLTQAAVKAPVDLPLAVQGRQPVFDQPVETEEAMDLEKLPARQPGVLHRPRRFRPQAGRRRPPLAAGRGRLAAPPQHGAHRQARLRAVPVRD